MRRIVFLIVVMCLCRLGAPAQLLPQNGYEVAQEGAWCWFADPRALHYSNKSGTINKSWIGYIDIHGNIKAMQYDFLKHKQQEVLVRSYFQPDDHDNPTFLVLPDERVMIFYSRHTDEPCFYYRVSRKPGDITTLGDEKVIPVKNKTTYPSPFILSDDPTHIYLCWRGIKWHPTIARLTIPDASDNLEIDWGPYQMVQSTGARPYCKYQSNGKDKIYLTYTTGHPDNEYPNFLYFNFVNIHNLQLNDINGNILSTISQGPFQVNKRDSYVQKYPFTVIDNPEDKRDWVWQIAYNKTKEPVIAMVRISKDKSSHNFYYVKWHNKTWKKTFLGNAGGHFHQTPDIELCYSSGMAIDPANPNIIYCSLPTEGKHGKVYELFKFTMNEAGDIVKKEAVTKDSYQNNVRPYILPGSEGSPLRLAWMRGEYYDWIVSKQRPLGYNTSVFADFKGFPRELNTSSAPLRIKQEKAKGVMDVAKFPAQSAFTLTADIDTIPTNYSGVLVTAGDLSYSIQEGTLKPIVSIAGKTYTGTNKLATADSWTIYGRGTNGKWYKPVPLTRFQLTLNYKNGILRTYINGMADQTIEIGRLKINNAYILNINGKNKLILRKAQ